jgi:transcriptional regulator with XRE-family HTH domain
MAARSEIDGKTSRRVAAWIRMEMDDRGIQSVRAFAKTIDVSHAYLSRVLSGDQNPGLELVLRLTRRLELSADRLLNEDPPGSPTYASEPVARTRPPAGAPPPGARRIDPERWLARAREARKLVRSRPTDSEISKLKREGRP